MIHVEALCPRRAVQQGLCCNYSGSWSGACLPPPSPPLQHPYPARLAASCQPSVSQVSVESSATVDTVCVH
ncbi:hypothetical protein J6590_027608 [Homalodisca vitripennis]|nr:hypothetical protein J6590_027608 [Homalodisca vitripennis]